MSEIGFADGAGSGALKEGGGMGELFKLFRGGFGEVGIKKQLRGEQGGGAGGLVGGGFAPRGDEEKGGEGKLACLVAANEREDLGARQGAGGGRGGAEGVAQAVGFVQRAVDARNPCEQVATGVLRGGRGEFSIQKILEAVAHVGVEHRQAKPLAKAVGAAQQINKQRDRGLLAGVAEERGDVVGEGHGGLRSTNKVSI